MDYHKQAHCIYHCNYHIVFVTKYRRRIFNDGVHSYMEMRLLEVQKYYPEIVILENNHDKDHIHLLISIPPKLSVAEVVKILKINTARHLKKEFDFIKEAYWWTDGIWSDGYFVSTVWVNEETIRRYIEQQGNEDSGQAKLVL